MGSHDVDSVHETVARAYAAAINKKQEKDGCCSKVTPCGVAAQTAGYGDEARFGEAFESSFGCGNPLAFAGVEAGETVLDLGSGAGLDLLIAAEKVGATGRVIGVDMTDEMIEAARRNLDRAQATNVEVRKGHIEKLPVEDGSVDWVISNCVINLSPQKSEVFQEIHRVLKPGGRFSVSDIVAEDLPNWIRESAATYSACIGGSISEGEYMDGLRRAGLVDVQATERLVYTADQIRGMVASDLENLGVTSEVLDQGLEQVQGKVWSVRLSGRKP